MGLHKYQSPRILAFLVSETAKSSELPRHVRQLLAEQLGNYDAEEAVDGLVELIDDPVVVLDEVTEENIRSAVQRLVEEGTLETGARGLESDS